MTLVYKHMTRENAVKLSHGHIRIGSFAYYHGAEHSAAIRDQKEGVTVGTTGRVILTSPPDGSVEKIIAGLKFIVGSGSVADVSNNTFIRTVHPCYLFCTSFVDIAGDFEGYDTVVRINDIEHFGRILVDGRRDLFQGYYSGLIKYQRRTYDAMNHPGLDPDPFVKEESFSRDQEFRLVFPPTGTVEPYVDIWLDAIKKAFDDRLCELL